MLITEPPVITPELSDAVRVIPLIRSEPRLIVGVGYPHPNLKRKQHPDVYNKDIGIEEGKHGKDDENWVYPSMIEEDMIKEAYYNYQKIDVWLNDTRVDINKI